MSETVDALDFVGKLEALDHYARALLFDRTFYRWVEDSRDSYGECGQHQQEIGLWTMGTDIRWVDEDLEAAPNVERRDPDLTTAAWQAWQSRLKEVVQRWLTASSAGPMHEVLALRAGTVPQARPAQSPAEGHSARYRIKYSTVHEWRDNPHMIELNQGTHVTVYDDPVAANRAVRNIAMKALRAAIEHEMHEFRQIKAFFDSGSGETPAYSINHQEISVVHLQSETLDRRGMKRVRLLFCDEYDDTVKVVAWVEPVGEDEE